MAMGRVAAKKAKTRPRVSQRECQLALQQVQFLGSEALRPAPQGHNAKPNTQPRPGPMGRLAFLQGIPDWGASRDARGRSGGAWGSSTIGISSKGAVSVSAPDVNAPSVACNIDTIRET